MTNWKTWDQKNKQFILNYVYDIFPQIKCSMDNFENKTITMYFMNQFFILMNYYSCFYFFRSTKWILLKNNLKKRQYSESNGAI